jgi:hypothetical protein
LSAHAARAERFAGPDRAGALAVWRAGAGTGLTVAIGVALSALAFVATGGLELRHATSVELALTLGGAAIVAGAIVLAPAGRSLYGVTATALLVTLAGLTALSVAWSVAPDTSWVEASRTFAYAATFAAAAALARLAPARWPSVIGGVALGALIVCGYALVTKVFPELNAGEVYARLRQPYEYWNAVGLSAALGAPACMWLGARRSGHAALNALAYPVLGVLLVTLFVAYSRGALLALAIGCAFWFAAVPLRLRGLTVLAVSGAGAAGVVAWVFTKAALTQDRVPVDQRAGAGHAFGVLLLAMLILLLAAGLAIGFFSARHRLDPRTRQRAGVAVLAALALVPFAGAIGLTASARGFTGSISHAWRSLTDPNARTPPNDPGRLTAIGSVRARYWNDALKIFRDNPLIGVGSGGYATARLHYRTDNLDVHHAHGYVVQTLADLGLVGLLVNVALLAAWLVAAIRSARPFGWSAHLRDRAPPLHYSPERVGLLTLFAIVVVFGVHSLIDWTWFVPGNACVALLCAGWLAGRGPLHDANSAAPRDDTGGWRRRLARWRESPWQPAGAAALLAVGLVVAWAQLQPVRSLDAGNAALAAASRHDIAAARGAARSAIARDPLSVEPLFDMAVVDVAAGNLAAARVDLQRAVRLQPSNPGTWLRLAEFDLTQRNDHAAALHDLGALLYLDPRSLQGIGDYLGALRAGPTGGAQVPMNPTLQPSTSTKTPPGTT